MTLLRWAVRLHKWIALVVGAQVLLWVIGGLVMTSFPLQQVRGEHHIPAAAPAALDLATVLPLGEVATRAAIEPARAELRTTPRGPVWMLTPVKGEAVLLDARTGASLGDISRAQALAFAATAYRGKAAPVSAVHLKTAPPETGKSGPLWRVDFADPEHSSLYLSPSTGETVSRRSNLWRFYDFFWRLHIMNLVDGENFHHPLIIGAALLALTIVLSGFVLLWNRLSRDLRTRRAAGRLAARA